MVLRSSSAAVHPPWRHCGGEAQPGCSTETAAVRQPVAFAFAPSLDDDIVSGSSDHTGRQARTCARAHTHAHGSSLIRRYNVTLRSQVVDCFGWLHRQLITIKLHQTPLKKLRCKVEIIIDQMIFRLVQNVFIHQNQGRFTCLVVVPCLPSEQRNRKQI